MFEIEWHCVVFEPEAQKIQWERFKVLELSFEFDGCGLVAEGQCLEIETQRVAVESRRMRHSTQPIDLEWHTAEIAGQDRKFTGQPNYFARLTIPRNCQRRGTDVLDE